MVKKAALATPNRLLKAARKERGWSQQQVADLIGAPLSLNISRWENGTAYPSPYYLERLCQLFGKSVRELGLSKLEDDATLVKAESPLQPEASSQRPEEQDGQVALPRKPAVWMTPYPRNLFFLGREELLTQLHHHLQADPAHLSQPQALCGLGGVGKTQVALEYTYRYAEDYQTVIWTRADTRDALVAGFIEIAGMLSLPEHAARDQSITVAAVKHWFSQHTGWLLILDNADDLPLLPEFLPSPVRGHLLLTTRAQALGRLANRIEVEPLDMNTATLLLLRRAGLLALDASLDEAQKADLHTAAQISQELGGLPLALDQAAAYMEETYCSPQRYLNLYRSYRADLLQHRGGLIPDHPHSVATTWSLSFTSLEQRSPLAADILRLCALLYADAIPEELFLQGGIHLGPALAVLETDQLAFNQALAVIQNYSLLRRANSDQTFSMHQLVQAVLIDAMTEEEREIWRQRAIAALNALFPEVRDHVWGRWEQCARLLPHVFTLAVEPGERQSNSEFVSLLTRTADYLLQRAQYAQAEPLYLRALAMYEQMTDGPDPQIIFLYNGLACLYLEQGRYEQAEAFYLRNLPLWEQLFGPEHPDLPSPLNDLGILSQEQGNYQQAEIYLQRDLHIKEQTFGAEHAALASPLNNLACLYAVQARYTLAEPLLLRALRIDEQTFGSEHPEVAYSLTNLADLYQDEGRLELAEPLYLRALHIREQTLGQDHPQITFPLEGLANMYRQQGRYDQAEPLYQRVLSIRQRKLGDAHPHVTLPLEGLANLYREQGSYEQAEFLYLRALAIRQQQKGASHPETAESLYDLACLYELQGQPEKALTLCQEAFEIRVQRLGEEHPQTRVTRCLCTRLLLACGR